jgi:hypothetical protein
MNKTDKAYLAGLIDGEGHIGLYIVRKEKKGFRPAIGIANTNLKVLEWVKSNYEGCLSTQRFIDTTRKTVYSWSIGSKSKCLRLLNDVLPYLRIKKEQAVLLIEYCKTKGWRKMEIRDWEIKEKLHALKKET